MVRASMGQDQDPKDIPYPLLPPLPSVNRRIDMSENITCPSNKYVVGNNNSCEASGTFLFLELLDRSRCYERGWTPNPNAVGRKVGEGATELSILSNTAVGLGS